MLLAQGHKLVIDRLNFRCAFRSHAAGLDRLDQGRLTGDVFADRFHGEVDRFLRMGNLLLPTLVAQEVFCRLIIALIDEIQRLLFAPVQVLPQTALFRCVAAKSQHILFQRVELLGKRIPLLAVFQQHSRIGGVVLHQGSHLRERRKFVLQLFLLPQQALHRLILAVERDMLHGQHGLAVQLHGSLLQCDRAAHFVTAGQLQQDIQLDAVDMREDAVIMPQLLVQLTHKVQHALLRFALRQLLEVCIDLRRLLLQKALAGDFKFLSGIVTGFTAENHIEELAVPDLLIVLLLLSLRGERVAEILAENELEIHAALHIDIIQRADIALQPLPLLGKLTNGRGKKNFDLFHHFLSNQRFVFSIMRRSLNKRGVSYHTAGMYITNYSCPWGMLSQASFSYRRGGCQPPAVRAAGSYDICENRRFSQT